MKNQEHWIERFALMVSVGKVLFIPFLFLCGMGLLWLFQHIEISVR